MSNQKKFPLFLIFTPITIVLFREIASKVH